MKKIGCFRQDGDTFNGNITTLQFSVQARMVPNPRKDTADAPDFIVTQARATGYAPEIGFAWRRTAREDGTAYLVVEIDDPTCTHPIQATLWHGADGLWYLLWTRKGTAQGEHEALYMQEELKPPPAWHRAPGKMTGYLQELFPQLVL